MVRLQRRRQQNVELPEDLRRQIRRQAAAEGVPLREMYERLLRAGLRAEQAAAARDRLAG